MKPLRVTGLEFRLLFPLLSLLLLAERIQLRQIPLLVAVSYTHLDVYKRQRLLWIFPFEKTEPPHAGGRMEDFK